MNVWAFAVFFRISFSKEKLFEGYQRNYLHKWYFLYEGNKPDKKNLHLPFTFPSFYLCNFVSPICQTNFHVFFVSEGPDKVEMEFLSLRVHKDPLPVMSFRPDFTVFTRGQGLHDREIIFPVFLFSQNQWKYVYLMGTVQSRISQ